MGAITVVHAYQSESANDDSHEVSSDRWNDEHTTSDTVEATGITGEQLSTQAFYVDSGLFTFTAQNEGSAGNAITVELRDPLAIDSPLSIDVTGTDIVVNLPTDGAGDIIPTLATIIAAALNDDVDAFALISTVGTPDASETHDEAPFQLANGFDHDLFLQVASGELGFFTAAASPVAQQTLARPGGDAGDLWDILNAYGLVAAP